MARSKASYINKTPEEKLKQTAKAREKRSELATQRQSLTQGITKRIGPEVQNYIRESLYATDEKSKKSYMMLFVDEFLKEARNDPQSRCGQLLASSMFNDKLIEKLDEATSKAMAQDREFSRYRIRETLFDKQREVYDDKENEEIEIICSRRAGKTELNARLLTSACIEENTPCLYINLTFTNAISQQYGLCYELAKNYNLGIEKASSNDGEIIFKNGSSIKFRGNSNNAEADKHRGNKYKLIIIDEIGHQKGLKYLIEDVLTPAQKDYVRHQIIYTGTPPRVPHHYSEWLWNNPKVKHYHWTMKDNPFIPNAEEEIRKEAEKRGLGADDTYIKREYLGIMGAYDTESQVYKGFQTFIALPKENFCPTHVFIGVDFGGVDNNAVVCLLADAYTKTGYVPMEFKQNKMSTSEICSKILEMRGGAIALAKSLNKDFKEEHCIVIPDTNEPNTVFELQKIYNIPNVQKPYKHEMMWGVAQLQELSRSGIIKVLQDGQIADEFEQILYKRDDATGAVLNELDDDLYHGDLEAALRYASRHFCELILGRTQQKKSNYVDPKTATRPQYNTNDVSYDEGVIWD